MDIFTRLFDPGGFIPRRLCGDWTPQLMAMHRVSDLMIWAAYLAIPVVLVTIAFRRRRDIPFRGLFVLFGIFIVACGSSHLVEYIMFTNPLYRLAGVVKMITAIVSWATVFALIPVVPKALAMRTPDELEEEIQLRTIELEEANCAKDELLKREQIARAEAEAANRAKDEFLNTLSHELRTPLNSIMGWSSLLRAGVLDAETSEQAIQSIERNTQAQAQLVEDLLDVSRINEGKFVLESKPLDFASTIEAAVDNILPTLAAKNLTVETHIGRENCRVMGDAVRLQQVVWNLLTNASKFTPDGGHIEVSLRCQDEQVLLEIADNGIGIEADTLPHIWERFRQADSSTTRAHGGLGLGLAIVRSIVEMHGGTVQAYSEGENRGATFRVQLPSLKEPVNDATLESTSPLPSSVTEVASQSTLTGNVTSGASGVVETAQSLHDVRILVVDDERDSRNLVAMVLKQQGAQVKTAASAQEALAVARDWQPQAMVSDIGMPQMDGYQLLQALRAAPQSTFPALALTAYASVEARDNALKAGFQQHLSKPVDPEHLLTAVRQLVAMD
jgi:signal transduction histidine kinase/ActR/RegA family two-component response regulator